MRAAILHQGNDGFWAREINRDKNRLPSHLEAWSGSLDDSEAPRKQPGWKPLDTPGLAKRCGERGPGPAPQGPVAPRPKWRGHLGEVRVEEALMVPTSSPSVLGEGPSQLSTEQGEWAKEASKGPSGQVGCKGQEDTGSLALKELTVQGRRQPGKQTNISQS